MCLPPLEIWLRWAGTIELFGTPVTGLNVQSDTLLIFDLGAHLGSDTAYYLARGFRVVAVEANPKLARQLEALDVDGRLIVEGRALSSESGPVALHLPLESEASCWATISPAQALMLQRAKVRTKPLLVDTVTLDELVSLYGVPYYIKCDLEGSDAEFLRMLSRLSLKPRTVSVELTQVGLRAVWAQLKLIRESGYTRFYIRDQGNLPRAMFSGGMPRTIDGMWSGPFGVEIDDGSALSFGQVRRHALLIALRTKVFGEFGLAGKLRLYGLLKRLARSRVLRPLIYTSWYDIHCFADEGPD